MTAPRICNREGCTRPVFARAKCVSHYNSFIKSLRRKGSDLFAAVDTWAELQKVMPGTLRQLEARTGFAYNTVMKMCNAKHKADEAHIVNHLPPGQGGGARWVRVFAAGAGVDHVLTEKRKKAYALKNRRITGAAWKAAKRAEESPVPLIATRWNLAFFNPAQVRA